jgi:hypothetical protein
MAEAGCVVVPVMLQGNKRGRHGEEWPPLAGTQPETRCTGLLKRIMGLIFITKCIFIAKYLANL